MTSSLCMSLEVNRGHGFQSDSIPLITTTQPPTRKTRREMQQCFRNPTESVLCLRHPTSFPLVYYCFHYCAARWRDRFSIATTFHRASPLRSAWCDSMEAHCCLMFTFHNGTLGSFVGVRATWRLYFSWDKDKLLRSYKGFLFLLL